MSALLDDILTYETRVWEALVAGDAAADDAALSDDFLGVYPDGFAGKESHVGQLSEGPTIQQYVLADAQAIMLGTDHVLLAYRAEYTRRGCEDSEEMFVSSVWRRHMAGWVNIFSQDTPATGLSVP